MQNKLSLCHAYTRVHKFFTPTRGVYYTTATHCMTPRVALPNRILKLPIKISRPPRDTHENSSRSARNNYTRECARQKPNFRASTITIIPERCNTIQAALLSRNFFSFTLQQPTTIPRSLSLAFVSSRSARGRVKSAISESLFARSLGTYENSPARFILNAGVRACTSIPAACIKAAREV